MRASFNPAPLKRKLQNRAQGFSRDLGEELRRVGRVVAVSLATSAQPYGIGEYSRRSGEIATARDIRRCYATPGQVYKAFDDKFKAGSFWKAIKAADYSRAQQIMRKYCPRFATKELKPFDGGAAHKAARNARGRVSSSQEPAFVVQTTRDLEAYIKSEVYRVGEGKAGWASCAKILGGTRGLPQWVTRHAGKIAPGSVVQSKSSIVLRNEVPYAENILQPAAKAEAVRIGIDRLTKQAIIAERRAARANAL